MFGTKIVLLMFTFVASPALFGAQDNRQQSGNAAIHDVRMLVTLLSPISTKSSKEGDTFSAKVTSPSAYEGIIEGRIAKMKIAKRRDKAEILFAFETLTLQGKTYPVRADLQAVANSKGLKGVDEEGRAIGQSSRKKRVGGTLVGTAVGGTLGGLLGGGRGAVEGAALGAGTGFLIAVQFTTSGSDIEFWPGSVFTLVVSDRRR